MRGFAEGESEMCVYQGDADRGSETLPTSAATELAARVNDAVQRFAAHVAPPLQADALEALRADILELARAHAARTVLETITARDVARAAKRQRRPWGRHS
jgi:histone H3/H4